MKQFSRIFLWLFSSFWAFLTGIFFALPTLSPWVGGLGIAIALLYCLAIYQWGKRAVGWAIGLTTVAVLIVGLQMGFSVINYMVWMTIVLNFAVWGQVGLAWRRDRACLPYFFPLAGGFAGALSVGWLCGFWLS